MLGVLGWLPPALSSRSIAAAKGPKNRGWHQVAVTGLVTWASSSASRLGLSSGFGSSLVLEAVEALQQPPVSMSSPK